MEHYEPTDRSQSRQELFVALCWSKEKTSRLLSEVEEHERNKAER